MPLGGGTEPRSPRPMSARRMSCGQLKRETMQQPVQVPEIFRRLQQRSENEGGLFWTSPEELCVFEPRAAQEFNRRNFADSTLSDRWIDLLLRRPSPPVTWQELRVAWTDQLRHMVSGAASGQLAQAMASHCESTGERTGDLGNWAQELCGRSLLPLVIDGLSPREAKIAHRDRRLKTEQLLALPGAPRSGLWLSLWTQLRLGQGVRRQLRQRAAGRSPRRHDLADCLVELLPRLGLDRAVDALCSILTAIAGPPGAAATCLLFELSRRPQWRHRLAAELAPLTPIQLAKAPARMAPLTHDFVKESLRLWSLPLLMVRPVLVDMTIGDQQLRAGQRVLLSPYLMHRDAQRWRRAESLEPERWRRPAQADKCPADQEESQETVERARDAKCPMASEPTSKSDHSSPYVPFGWAPRSCLGANLAILQLMLLCRLTTTRYRVLVDQPDKTHVVLGTVPRVLGFEGRVLRR